MGNIIFVAFYPSLDRSGYKIYENNITHDKTRYKLVSMNYFLTIHSYTTNTVWRRNQYF
jgi:hypothetical protein